MQPIAVRIPESFVPPVGVQLTLDVCVVGAQHISPPGHDPLS